MQGEPWHVGYTDRKKDEGRHKARCKYYDNSKNYCNLNERECTSSTRCPDYSEGAIIIDW